MQILLSSSYSCCLAFSTTTVYFNSYFRSFWSFRFFSRTSEFKSVFLWKYSCSVLGRVILWTRLTCFSILFLFISKSSSTAKMFYSQSNLLKSLKPYFLLSLAESSESAPSSSSSFSLTYSGSIFPSVPATPNFEAFFYLAASSLYYIRVAFFFIPKPLMPGLCIVDFFFAVKGLWVSLIIDEFLPYKTVPSIRESVMV